MRVAIAGAGNVGRSIARELIANGHEVLLIDRDSKALVREAVPGATWFQADACELDSLEEANLEQFDVAVAATGDDKANLVHSLLAKTEFGVPRTVGRVNHPGNEWMFDEVWGVDVSVSTPRLITALVEEAVTEGDLVRLMSFNQSETHLLEVTLTEESTCVGHRIKEFKLPSDAVLTAIIRDARPIPPDPNGALECGDKLLLLASEEAEIALADLLRGDVQNEDQPSS